MLSRVGSGEKLIDGVFDDVGDDDDDGDGDDDDDCDDDDCDADADGQKKKKPCAFVSNFLSAL